MHAYILVCLQVLWIIYVKFVVDIDIKIWGRGFLLHSCLLVPCVYVYNFLVYLLPYLLARLFVLFYFKLTLLRLVSPLFTQNIPYGVTIESGSNLSKYISTDSLILAHINNTKTLSAFSQKNEIQN